MAVDHVVAAGGVERGGQKRARARRLDQRHRAVDDAAVDALGPEVEDRRLGEAAAELVDGVEDDVGAAGERVGGELVGEGEVGAPGLVDDERDVAGVGGLGERRDVGDRAEVGGGDDEDGDRERVLVQRPLERLDGHAVGDAEVVVDGRGDEPRLQAAEDEPVDDRRVDVALNDRDLAEVRQRHADRMVAARGAVDEEPRAPRAPGLGGEPLRLLEGRVERVGADVEVLGPGREVERERQIADGLAPARIGPTPALVTGDVEAPDLAFGEIDERVEIRGLVLVHAVTVVPLVQWRRRRPPALLACATSPVNDDPPRSTGPRPDGLGSSAALHREPGRMSILPRREASP